MSDSTWHLAQVNIARLLAPLDDPLLADFVAQLDEINALADASPGFVWRFQGEAGNATYLRPYDDDRIIFNMSVWSSLAALKDYVFRTGHAAVMRRRKEWFAKFEGAYTTLWWVPAGHIPTVAEAKERLAHLQRCGVSPWAFTMAQVFEAAAAEAYTRAHAVGEIPTNA
jgi:hypothetical protein